MSPRPQETDDHPDGQVPGERPTPVPRNACCPWSRLTPHTWAAVAVTAIVLLVATVPRLPPGVCFSDAGDLQLASATLGIMHPPGYAGFATLGYLITRVPGVDPAYLISLACLASGVTALLICVLLQVRLGANPYMASALCLLLSAHPRIWTNLVVPEVYMPSVALLMAGAYLLLKYTRLGARSSLYWAATLFGLALANRPTFVWILPFFVAAWWVGQKRLSPSRKAAVKSFLAVTFFGILPGLYSLGYIWIRDRPDIPYNYIEMHNAEVHELPPSSEGWNAKLDRLLYHTTGREFERYFVKTWRGVRMRLRWLHHEFFLLRAVDWRGFTFLVGPSVFPSVLLLLTIGLVLTYRRQRPAAWLLMGLILGNVAFICTYNIHGMAADLLPLMLSATVLCGVAVSPLFPPGGTRLRRAPPMAALAAMGALTLVDAPHRPVHALSDATKYLRRVDLATLPKNSVICSTWAQTMPLWYAKEVLLGRHDIHIVNAMMSRWEEQLDGFDHRPMFATERPGDLLAYELTPYRTTTHEGMTRVHLWRFESKTE